MSISLSNESAGLQCLSSESYHHNSVSVAKLLSFECSLCYTADYKESTSTMDIMSCSGPILFVGTKSTRSSTFLHGAYGPSALVKASNPRNIPKIHNGVYWHFIEGTVFGFTYDIEAIPNGELGTMDTDKGVFWRLDAPSDKNGYKKDLNIGKIFNFMPHKIEKFIYNCPGKNKKKRNTVEKKD
jgi:hypothetical protein